MKKIICIFPLVIVFLFSAAYLAAQEELVSPDAEPIGGAADVEVGWANITPVIDGIWSDGEWSDALADAVAGAEVYYIYLKSNDEMLYGLIYVPTDTSLEMYDRFQMYFDNNYDGAWPPLCPNTAEGRYTIRWNGFTETFYETYYSTGLFCRIQSGSAITAAMALDETKGGMVYEFAIDLYGGEMYGEPGETIGFRMSVFDVATGTATPWPAGSNYLDPSTWGELVYPVCDGCVIDHACYEDGESNPDNECQICDVSQSNNSWTNDNGAICDDGLFCTGDDYCMGGSCSGHTGNPCPDNGLFCDGEENCNEGDDICEQINVPDCSDNGAFCDGDEFCNEDEDQCDHTGNPCPNNGLWCDGEESCNEGDDICEQINVPECPDNGQFCDGDEYCNEDEDQCDHTGNPCPDNGLFCDGEELCDEGDDLCYSTGDPCEDNGLFCDGNEFCAEATNECLSTGDPCADNGQFCDGDEFCNETVDACESTGDPCQEDEICNEFDDICEPEPDDDTVDDDTTPDDDTVDDDTTDDDTGDDDTIDDDTGDDDTIDDDTSDDDTGDDDTTDDDTGDDDIDISDDDDDDGGFDDGCCGC